MHPALTRLKHSAILALPAGCSLAVSLLVLPGFIRHGLSPIYEDAMFEPLGHIIAWIGVGVLLVIAISSAFFILALARGRIVVPRTEEGDPQKIDCDRKDPLE